MSEQIRLIMRIAGFALILLGAAMLGIAVGKLEKARAEGADHDRGTSIAGAATALCGSGTVLLATSSF